MSLKPTTQLVVRDWKQDVVNVVQFPRFHSVVSASPFALKLETWLRITKIDYHNVNNQFTKASSKGQAPFIELNGRQFADSNFIIEHLIQTYNVNLDGKLTTLQRAEARAIAVLVEESLFRCLAYDRSLNFAWIAGDAGAGPYLSGFKKIFFQKVVLKQLQSRIKNSLKAQGYGRHTPAEIEEIAKKDLNALSTILGNKKYLFGEHPSTVDANMFGTLVQFLDTPLNSDKLKPFITQHCANLVDFCKRIKAEYWPDWDIICEQLALNKEDIKPKDGEAGPSPPTSPPPAH